MKEYRIYGINMGEGIPELGGGGGGRGGGN